MFSFLEGLFGNRSAGRALVVESETTIRKLLALYLDRIDMEAVLAADAEEAEAAWARGRFDFFVINVKLGRDNGVLLADSLRKRPGASSTPIIFLSAQHPRDQMRLLEERFSPAKALAVPFDSREFRQAALMLTGRVVS